jgi:hypothetical protein
VVVTKGFRDDPNLDLLEETRWRLSIDLDEEEDWPDTRMVLPASPEGRHRRAWGKILISIPSQQIEVPHGTSPWRSSTA